MENQRSNAYQLSHIDAGQSVVYTTTDQLPLPATVVRRIADSHQYLIKCKYGSLLVHRRALTPTISKQIETVDEVQKQLNLFG